MAKESKSKNLKNSLSQVSNTHSNISRLVMRFPPGPKNPALGFSTDSLSVLIGSLFILRKSNIEGLND
jgi:hypothetical protein